MRFSKSIEQLVAELEKSGKEYNTRRVLIWGTSNLAEVSLLYKRCSNVTFWLFDVIDFNLSPREKNQILKIENFGASVKFLKPRDCKPNSYDLVLCMNCGFRHVSANVYKVDPVVQELVNTDFPIYSDQNDALGFIKQLRNLYRFFLNVTKAKGLVICYPAALSFELFGKLEHKSDFTILDWQPEITYVNNVNCSPPSFASTPLVLHYQREAAHHQTSFLASELLNIKKGVTRAEATFDLSRIAPKLLKYFKKRNLMVELAVVSYANCIRKTQHVNYSIDYELFDKYLQLPTKTMAEVGKLKTPDELFTSQKFVNSINYGMRIYRSCPAVNRILVLEDQRWCDEAFPGSKINF